MGGGGVDCSTYFTRSTVVLSSPGLEEKKKQIEAEQHSVELTGISVDTLDSRPSFTR